MVQFCVEIADDKSGEVVSSLCSNFGYEAQVNNPNFDSEVEESEENSFTMANPESPNAFANRMCRQWLVEQVYAKKRRIARQAARNVDVGISMDDIIDPDPT